MSLEKFADLTASALQERAAQAINRAVNVRPVPAQIVPDPASRVRSLVLPGIGPDMIALQTVEALAETRAYKVAEQIVAEVYKKLTEPQAPSEPEKPEPKGRMY